MLVLSVVRVVATMAGIFLNHLRPSVLIAKLCGGKSKDAHMHVREQCAKDVSRILIRAASPAALQKAKVRYKRVHPESAHLGIL